MREDAIASRWINIRARLYLQGGYLSGPTALPASFNGIIMISYKNSVHTAITPLKLAGSAVGPLRLPPCTQATGSP